MEGDEECQTGLCLGIGTHGNFIPKIPKHPVQLHVLFPHHNKDEKKEDTTPDHESQSRSMNLGQEEGGNDSKSKDICGNTRKKLRLTREQLTSLEESFREHHTLNLTQKQELAKRLKLMPRQVEVWFQNRRARSKMKKTELDCERLRNCCERLSDENWRLRRELQELKSSMKPSTLIAGLTKVTEQTTTLTTCPSCERMEANSGSKCTGGGMEATAIDGAKRN